MKLVVVILFAFVNGEYTKYRCEIMKFYILCMCYTAYLRLLDMNVSECLIYVNILVQYK